ncbi:hypothetical protein AAVH_18531 [Aphelenchoides avenae]|nr:hypothetical protein AAVH_18531 [Aphelenchus avenae]
MPKARSYHDHFLQMMTQLPPERLQLVLSHLDRVDAESFRCTCTTLRKVADKNYDVFQVPEIKSIRTCSADYYDKGTNLRWSCFVFTADTFVVDATIRIDFRVDFIRNRSFPGKRVVNSWLYTGTCAQLTSRLHNLLNGCAVSNAIDITWYADGSDRDLYRLVRTIADAVQLKNECIFSLRKIEVNVGHVHQWRTMFPKLKLIDNDSNIQRASRGRKRREIFTDGDGQERVYRTALDERYQVVGRKKK